MRIRMTAGRRFAAVLALATIAGSASAQDANTMSVNVSIDAATVDTRVAMRDNDLKGRKSCSTLKAPPHR